MDKRMPVRTCVGCNIRKSKQELIRIVRLDDGRILADETGKMNGRGAYLCRDAACLEAAIRKKSFNRHFKMEVSAEDIERIREMFNET